MSPITAYIVNSQAFLLAGLENIPWLGNLENLCPVSAFETPPHLVEGGQPPFPVRPSEKRSYAQSCVVWIKAAGLQVCELLSFCCLSPVLVYVFCS